MARYFVTQSHSSPKNRNVVIIYSPLWHSKPVCDYFFCGTQKEDFSRNSSSRVVLFPFNVSQRGVCYVFCYAEETGLESHESENFLSELSL